MGWMRQAAVPIVIHTDGSCLYNPGGTGGWAAVILKDGQAHEMWGAELHTTNNRMEMTAVIKALQSLPTGSNVYVFTDSQYVQKGIVYWVPSWRKREWLNSQGKQVANKDLWLLLDKENNRHIISWHWVKGHGGDRYNERCDALAYSAACSCNQLQEKESA